MIVLDSNVFSALTRAAPEEIVRGWLDAQPRSSIWTTSITLFEVRVGIAAMPDGRRCLALEGMANRLVSEFLEGRILAFDAAAAEASAALAAARRRQGRPGGAIR